nr:MAG TPA: hypothetical protein [Caudoviricetes sp.]
MPLMGRPGENFGGVARLRATFLLFGDGGRRS